jgi:hypothetical protein
VPEPVPVLHPNLPALYRRKVETLEEALKDEGTALPAAEALRLLIDAILVTPGERRGEVSLSLRGDLPPSCTWPRPSRRRTAKRPRSGWRTAVLCLVGKS